MGAAAVKINQDGDCSAISPAAMASISAIPTEDRTISLGETFRLESGEALAEPTLRIRLFEPASRYQRSPSPFVTPSSLHSEEGRRPVTKKEGKRALRVKGISEPGFGETPVIAVAGGISAGRNVADAEDGAGWWRDLVGPGRAVDADRFRILGFDFLPGREACAVTITPNDQARALAIALDGLGVAALHAFVGASYGGFVGLAFAALYPQRLGRLCAVSAAARPDPMATALRGLQRRIIALGLETGREAEGVALARALAMTTYRSPEEFRERFESAPLGARAGDLYDVCGYLQARGEAYAKTMSGMRYISLSDSLDRAAIDAGRIVCDCLFVASASDRLVPARDTEATARAVSGRSSYLAIDSLVGHDAFLCEVGKFGPRVCEFIEGE